MQTPELLIGISGGIAAYKSAEFVSRCVQADMRCTVVMTDHAKHFIGATTFEALTGQPVYQSLFQPQEHFKGEHIALAERAHLFCIAPATANVIAKLANGIADDLLTTLALSFTGPILIAPAMNKEMWAKPVVQRNISQLRSDSYLIQEPGEGWLSCRTVGVGRMAEPETLYHRVSTILNLKTE